MMTKRRATMPMTMSRELVLVPIGLGLRCSDERVSRCESRAGAGAQYTGAAGVCLRQSPDADLIVLGGGDAHAGAGGDDLALGEGFVAGGADLNGAHGAEVGQGDPFGADQGLDRVALAQLAE